MFWKKKLYKILFERLNDNATVIIAARSAAEAIDKFLKMYETNKYNISVVWIEEYRMGG